MGHERVGPIVTAVEKRTAAAGNPVYVLKAAWSERREEVLVIGFWPGNSMRLASWWADAEGFLVGGDYYHSLEDALYAFEARLG